MNDCQKRGGGISCDRFRWNKLIKGGMMKALPIIMIVLVDRKTDGFQDEIYPKWKKDKQKLDISL